MSIVAASIEAAKSNEGSQLFASGDEVMISDGLKEYIDNIYLSKEVISLTTIKVADLYGLQADGALSFGAKDNSYSEIILNAKRVKFDNVNTYAWYGATEDHTVELSVSKTVFGYSGYINDFVAGIRADLLPIDSAHSVLIEYLVDEKIVDCGTIGSDEKTEFISDYEECMGECLGDFSILFIVPPAAESFFVNNQYSLMYIDGLVNELRNTLVNSEINHQVYYDLVFSEIDLELDPIAQSGTNDIMVLPDNTLANQLREDYKADIVVAFTPGNFYLSSNSTAAVAQTLSDPDNAYMIMDPAFASSNYIFSHEIGHIFGAQHEYVGTNYSRGDCAYPHLLIAQGLWTTMEVVPRIPYYSNPDVFAFGENLGSDGSGPNETRAENNAGVIRANGCYVSNFREDNRPQVSVEVQEVDCEVVFSVISDSSIDGLYFTWTWNKSGFFNNGPDDLVFSNDGSQVALTEPFDLDVCTGFFVMVEAHNQDGDLIFSEVVYIPRGIFSCFNNIWCGGDPPSQGYQQSEMGKYATTRMIVLERIEGSSYNSKFICFDLLGRFKCSRGSLQEIVNEISNFPSGSYLVCHVSEDNVNTTIINHAK